MLTRVRPSSVWLWAGGLAVCLGAAAFVLRPRAPAVPPLQISAATPAILTAKQCGALQAQYTQLLEPMRACHVDDDCVAEPRAQQHWDLDGCGRYRARSTSVEPLDAIERQWQQGACMEGYVAECKPVRAQCLEGRCEELPPDPLPRTWKRVMAHGRFSMFVPRDFIDEKAIGQDSLVGSYAAPLGALHYDYGEYSNRLEGDDMPNGEADAPRKTRSEPVTIAGQHARFVTWRGTTAVHAGLYISFVPRPGNPAIFDVGSRTRLQMTLSCASDCEATFHQIARSIEFY
jgi:hypothetical protein